MKYGKKRKVNYSFEDAVLKVKNELAEEDFGILNEVDVRKKLKDKLNVDFGKYVILGACNPKFAYEVLSKEIDVGLLLPCNVVIYEINDEVFVSVVLPRKMMNLVKGRKLKHVASIVESKLLKVINSV
jgi:uncharacterized protein (DUF302 family)